MRAGHRVHAAGRAQHQHRGKEEGGRSTLHHLHPSPGGRLEREWALASYSEMSSDMSLHWVEPRAAAPDLSF